MHVGVSDTSTDRSHEFGNSASVEAPPIVDAVRGEGPGSPPQPRPTPEGSDDGSPICQPNFRSPSPGDRYCIRHPAFPGDDGQYDRCCPILELLVVMLIVMIVPVAPADLSADLTRRECCRVDIRISRIRGQRVFERVEVAGVNVLPCNGYDTSRRERACNGPGIRRA